MLAAVLLHSRQIRVVAGTAVRTIRIVIKSNSYRIVTLFFYHEDLIFIVFWNDFFYSRFDQNIDKNTRAARTCELLCLQGRRARVGTCVR